ncbi:MAG: hypothetical protein MHM6MM_002924 [Cercozoa sp. M6MM]
MLYLRQVRPVHQARRFFVRNTAVADDGSDLFGSAPYYSTHLGVVVETPAARWPAQLTDFTEDNVDEYGARQLQHVQEQVQALRRPGPLRLPNTKVTAIDASVLTECAEDLFGGDVLVFPDNVLVRGTIGDAKMTKLLEALAESQLDWNKPLQNESSADNGNWKRKFDPFDKVLTKHEFKRLSQTVLVCAHAQRDVHCRRCGGPTLQVISRHVDNNDVAEDTMVLATSHVGGHKYAPCILTYPSGNWYGLVEPQELPELLTTEAKGGTYWHKWRGRAGTTRRQYADLIE